MKKYLKSWRERLIGPLATKADLDNLYLQLSSLMEIRNIIGPGVPLGPLRGWALSPDALLMILRDIMTRKVPRVLEFGSGESTIAIAASLRAVGSGTLTSIEHDADFAAAVGRRLNDLKLADHVDQRVVPLSSYESRFGLPAFKSYDLTRQTGDFDIALVDGPITPRFGAATRAVPLEWCLTRLSAQNAIYLDDAARWQERSVVDGLAGSFPAVEINFIATEKGLYRLAMPDPQR